MIRYTKVISRDGKLVRLPSDSTERHELVLVERPDLGFRLLVAAYMTPTALPWAKAVKAAEKIVLLGVPMRAPEVEEAFLICDRSQDPVLPVEFFPDAEDRRWTWTATPVAGSSVSAWIVYFGSGGSNWDVRSYGNHVRAVCSGQALLDLGVEEAA